MTKAEKRYFATFCFNQNISKNYIRLYEFIVKQEAYDEALIRKKFKGAAFLKQLHVAKNYLQQLILRSLRNYHAKISKPAEIKDILRNAEILFSRELFDLCHYEIVRAEKIAKAYDILLARMEILKWKRKLALAKGGHQRAYINELLLEEKALLTQLGYINELWQLINNIFDYIDDQEEHLLKSPLLQVPESDLPLTAKTLKHHLLYSYFILNKRPDEAYPQLQRSAALLEKDPKKISNDPSPYTTVLNNQIGFLIQTKNYEAVGPLIEKVKAIPEKYQLKSASKFSVKLRLRTYNIELEMYRDLRNFKKGIELMQEIETYLGMHLKSIPDQYYLLFWYQFANICFMSGDLAASLKYVNKIINTRFDSHRIDLQKYARYLNLMIHFELDNTIVLRYAIESCRRFLRKIKQTAPFEKVLLRFFSKICNAPRKDYIRLFKSLHTDFFAGDPVLVNDYILDYLDFKNWISKNAGI